MSESGWLCKKGAALLIPSGPDDKKHLMALLLDPVCFNGYGAQPQVLMVSVVTIKPGLIVDDSCILDVGDHPFISHPSFVDYRFARVDAADHVQGRANENIFIPQEPCSEELIKRVISGALKSRRIPREFKQLLEKVVFG